MSGAITRRLADKLITSDIEALVARSEKRVGSFGYDPWGYNEQAVKLVLGAVKLLYERYFRVRAYGLENVPKSGPLLVVANHSGQLPMDGVLLGYALMTNPHGPRAPRAMIERFLPTVPWVGNLLNQFGGVTGDPGNCARMLERDEAILVFPEGARGAGKPYRKRYQLQAFGSGFMHLAMQHRVPVLPVGIVGCEETMPSLGSITPLARLLSVPYIPIAPPVPLPARVSLHFGAPMHFDAAAVDEQAVAMRVEQVKAVIREGIDAGLRARGGRIF